MKFGSKRPGLNGTRHALMQYDRNSLRMVSEDLVRWAHVSPLRWNVTHSCISHHPDNRRNDLAGVARFGLVFVISVTTPTVSHLSR